MDKIKKALARLRETERAEIRRILDALARGDTKGLDIKKLKGRDDIFRVRKGALRVIYRAVAGKVFILAIERRSEKTYRDF